MKLRINNFAKIKSADFSINGITVIAGNNNMGKSTVGKILSSIFNSLLDIQAQVKRSRIKRMEEDAWDAVLSEVPFRRNRFFYFPRKNSVKDFVEATSSDDKQKAVSAFTNTIIQHVFDSDVKIDKEKIATVVYNAFEKSANISDEELENEIVSIYFRRIFNQQINNIYSPSEIANVGVTVKGEKIDIDFESDKVQTIKRDFHITNSAIYIENPYIIDRLNQSYGTESARSYMSSQEQDLFYRLLPREDEDIGMVAINQLSAEKALDEVISRLNGVVPGNIELKDRFVYNDTKGHFLNVNSLSTGLKSFTVIKQLLAQRSLKNKDVLILDEPEIHLHPDWQLRYAEIIVLLQKDFDLNIVITTHSPHFLEAIDVYSKVHKSKEKCNYYLAEDKGNGVEFSDVTNDIGSIYTSLVEPNLRIDQIKAEYGIVDDE